MGKLVWEGPMQGLEKVDCFELKCCGDPGEIPPGTTAVSADHQSHAEANLTNRGFQKFVEWERLDSDTILTLWRKPGLVMPHHRRIPEQPPWDHIRDLSVTNPEEQGISPWLSSGLDFWSCCGTVLREPRHLKWYKDGDTEIAGVFLSINRPTENHKKSPSFRIWEGYFKSEYNGEVRFDGILRMWLRLPYGTKYKVFHDKLD